MSGTPNGPEDDPEDDPLDEEMLEEDEEEFNFDHGPNFRHMDPEEAVEAAYDDMVEVKEAVDIPTELDQEITEMVDNLRDAAHRGFDELEQQAADNAYERAEDIYAMSAILHEYNQQTDELAETVERLRGTGVRPVDLVNPDVDDQRANLHRVASEVSDQYPSPLVSDADEYGEEDESGEGFLNYLKKRFC